MSRLFTTSLVGKVEWMKSCPPSWRKKAYKDMQDMLAREWNEPGPAAKLGIEFESCLYRVLESGIAPENLAATDQFKNIVRRYYKKNDIQIQKKVKRFIDFNGHEYCLYGKLDIYHPTRIEDIKTTTKIMDNYHTKYLDTFQHHLYCFITEIPDFIYFIVAFNEHNQSIHSVHEVEYHSPGPEYERQIVEQKIIDVFFFLGEHPELLKLYDEKYCLY